MATPRVPSSTSLTFQPDIFKGKVLFCTGGRGGIIYRIVEALMNHGVDAAIFGRNSKGVLEAAEKLSQSTGRRCIGTSGDVRKPDDLKKAVEKTVEEFGRIDYVICGAAGNFLASINGLSENAFKTVVDIDLLGTYNTIKSTLPHIRKSQGSYIHISATLHYRGTAFQAHVSAAKAGVDALSQVLAVEEGPRGVRSNVIAPGMIAGTEGFDRLAPTSGQKLQEMVPLGRLGEAADIASMAVFLFSDAANWITGQIFVVDGGEHHVRGQMFPYPQSLLDPNVAKGLMKAKL